MPERLVLGTRGSKLALAQSRQVAARIADATGARIELEIIQTRGDRVQDRALAEIGGKGLFTAELEAALREGRVDFAVHSLKDLPTDDPEGLTLGCVPERADPRDALAGRDLDALEPGDVVGTGSLRRQAQLRLARPDLRVEGIRGNVDTRLRKLDEGRYHAIVLAMAGLARLGIERPDIHPLPLDRFVPAVGQGALGLQCRADDDRVLALLRAVEHAPTRRCVEVERAFLTTYGGGCNVPAACHARLDASGRFLVRAVAEDGAGRLVRVEESGPDGVAIGRRLGEALRA